ncbi:MAG: hypothetical protein ACLQQ4_15130 [Bacteroidia bacterium]
MKEESNQPEWAQKITLPLKPALYRYTKSKESEPGTAQQEDNMEICFSHEQALYMFYLAMGSFGITPSQYKRFADDIEAGNIIEPY